MKRLAFNHVKHTNFSYSPGVIEVEDNRVIRAYRLIEETEQTQWIGGTVCLKEENNRLQAYKEAKLIRE